EMSIWGGSVFPNQQFGPALPFSDGARYDPATDHWSPVSTNGAPPAARDPHFIWTGREMIVWGGLDSESATLDSGGRYDPSADSWKTLSPANTPTSRVGGIAAWTGQEMLVWGGVTYSSAGAAALNDGGRYSPECDKWTPLTLE